MRAWLRSLLVGSLLLASRARADSARGADALVYEAPANCPDRAAFIARIAARMKNGDASTQTEASTMRTIKVRIEVLAHGARAELEIEDAHGEHSKRTIQGATCAEVADAAALIAALAAGSASASGSSSSSGSSSDSGSSSSSSSGSEAEAETETETETKAETKAETESGSASASGSESDSYSEPDSVSDSGTAPIGSAAGDHLTLTASVLALTRILPTLEPAAQLVLTWSHPLSSSFVLSLLAGPRLSTSSRATDAQGNADLALYGATVAACTSARVQHDSWLASGCLALEPGLLAARGRDTRNPRDRQRAWFALGPGLGLSWAGAAPLVVNAGVELQVPLVRDRFILGGETVFRPPSVGVRAALGVGVQL